MSQAGPGVPALHEMSPADFRRRRDDVLEVYAAAMGVDRPAALARRSILATHEQRPGLVAVGADDAAGRLVAVAYGYLSRPGQWWHDQVTRALSPRQRQDWLEDCFEVCELHVLPQLQGQGLGRELLHALLTRTPAARAVLTTPDDVPTRARRFYAAGGWSELVTRLRFPGDARTFAVLGLCLDRSGRPPPPR